MKKLILCLIMICAVLAGCGGVEDPPSTTAPVQETPTATEPQVTEPTAEPTEAAVRILPLPATIDVNALDNCTVAVSLEEGDVYVDDSGVMQMKVTVYDYDLYDMVDIATMQVGDIIVLEGQDVEITALEQNDSGTVLINGGLDNGGYELATDEFTVYYLSGYSDVKSWVELGEATLPVSPDFVYTDSSDLDNDPVLYEPGDFQSEKVSIDYFFVPSNTTIVIENGMVIAMNRVYVP